MKRLLLAVPAILLLTAQLRAQDATQVVAQIEKEATENSQLQSLAHQLMDVIGPRLVGTPQMQAAHDWAVATFAGWGIDAA
ncbi:MAG TPA: hypothetical protein VLL47_01840, partial [Robiginitalea sp.]|nr:hypothetical protein [Robiginitalea sp.]